MKQNVAVIGIGHVGLVLSAGLAELGYKVVGVDLPQTIDTLRQGTVAFYEPGLVELVRKHTKSGQLFVTASLEEIGNASIVWVAVGTTQTEEGAIQVDKIERIIDMLGRICAEGTIIAIKSTMPIGTCHRLTQYLPVNKKLRIIYNPEFLRQGSALHDFFHPTKLVLGIGPDEEAEQVIEAFAPLPGKSLVTSWETAEAMKLVQNVFNALHISFMNELILTLEQSWPQISLEEISQMFKEDTVVLRRYMNYGFSYGGSCLPNNVAYLSYIAQQHGHSAPLLQAIQQVNLLRIDDLAQRICERLSGLEGKRITLWGLAFKDATDDLRGSPSVRFGQKLLAKKAIVQVYDLCVSAEAMQELNFIPSPSLEASLYDIDALVVLTRNAAFAEIPVATILNYLDIERIFDAVHALSQLKEVFS